MFQIEESVYFKGTSEIEIPFDLEVKKKKKYKPLVTNIISTFHDDVKMYVIRHKDGFDINLFIDAGLAHDSYKDSGITAIMVSGNTLEKIM